MPGGIALQLGGPYTDSVPLTIDLTGGTTTTTSNPIQIYFKSSPQDRDCVVEATATVTIHHEVVDPTTGLVIASYDYVEATTLLARALFLRPRLSFTKKVGTGYVPVDDEAIIPAPTIDPNDNVIAHSTEREFYLEYRTHYDPAQPSTASAQIVGGDQANNLTLTLAEASNERAVFRSRPIVSYLEQPGTFGLSNFPQLGESMQPDYDYILVDSGQAPQDRPYAITAFLTPPPPVNPLPTTFVSPTRPLTFLNVEAATDDVIVPGVPAPSITLDCFNTASPDNTVKMDPVSQAITLAISGSIRDAVGDVTPAVANRISAVTIDGQTFALTASNHVAEMNSILRPYAGHETFSGDVTLQPGFNTVQISAKNLLGVTATRTIQVELLDTANAFTDVSTMTARVRITEEPPVALTGTSFAFVHYRTSHVAPGTATLPNAVNVDVVSLDPYSSGSAGSTTTSGDVVTVTIQRNQPGIGAAGKENTYTSRPILVVPGAWDPVAITAARSAGIVLLRQKEGGRLLVQGAGGAATLPTRLGDVTMQNYNNSVGSRLRMLVYQGTSWVEQTRLKVGDRFTFEAEYLQPLNPGTVELVLSSCDRLGRVLQWPDRFVTLVMGFDASRQLWTMQGVENLATGGLFAVTELIAISRHGEAPAGQIPVRMLGGGTIQIEVHWYWSVDYDPVRPTLGSAPAPQESQCGSSARMGARDTVVARTGEVVIAETDAALNGRGSHLVFARTYRSYLDYDGAIGFSWSHSLESWLHRLGPDTYLWVGGGGRLATFTRQAGDFLPDQPGVYAILKVDAAANVVRVQWAGGSQEIFAPRAAFDPNFLPLTARYDRCRNKVAPIYNQSGILVRAEDPLQQPLHFVLDSWMCIAEVGDQTERRWQYQYFDGKLSGGRNGDLRLAALPRTTWTLDPHPPALHTYTYDSYLPHKLFQVQDPKGNEQHLPLLMELAYYPDGRARIQHFGDGNYAFTYAATQTTVLDRKKNKRTFDFKPGVTSELDTLPITYTEYDTNGTAYATTYDHNSQGEIKSVTPPAGAMTPTSEFDFDEAASDPRDRGNLLRRRMLAISGLPSQYQNLYQTVALDVQTDPAPTQLTKLEWVYTYTVFQLPKSMTDPLQRVTTSQYDPLGNQIEVDYPPVATNVLGGTRQQYVAYSIYNNFGDVFWRISPAGVVTRYQYYPAGDPNGAGGTLVTSPSEPSGHLCRTSMDSATPPPSPATVTRSPSLTPPEERRITCYYDAHGYLQAIVDPKRLSTTVHHDELGILKQRIEPDGPTRDFKHDANGQMIAETVNIADVEILPPVAVPPLPAPLPTKVVTAHDYDRVGNPTTTTIDQGGLNLITKLEYDPNENVIHLRTPVAMAQAATADDQHRYTSNDYDGLDRQIHSTQAPDVLPARKTDFDYYNDGKLKTKTDANGITTRYFYNCFGFLVEEMDKDGNSRRTWRDSLGHITVLERYGSIDGSTGNVGSLSMSVVYLDELDREIAHADQVFRWDQSLTRQNIGRRVSEWIHDAADNIVESINPRQYHVTATFNGHGQKRSDHGSLTGDAAYAYDPNGNLHVTTLPPAPGFAATSLVREYDSANRKISEQKIGGGVTNFGYDTLGRLRFTTDQVGNRVFHEHDAAGRQTRMIREMDSINPATSALTMQFAVTQYSYDLNSNLRTVLDTNQNPAVAFTYEAHEQVQTTTYPDDGFPQLTRPGAARTTTSLYHPNGLLLSTITPDALTVTHQYSNARLLSQRTVSAPAGSSVPGTTKQTFTYDGAGRCISSTDDNGDPNRSAVTTTRYDSLDNIWEDFQNETYSGTGARVNVPEATYNAAGELAQITYPLFGVPIPYGFDVAGRPNSCGQFSTYLYQGSYLTDRYSANRINLILTQNAQGVIADRVVKDSATGNILGGNKYTQWNTAALPIMNQNLGAATSTVTGAVGAYNEQYVYDSAYRIITNVKYDSKNQPTSVSALTYDLTGNTIELQTGGPNTPGDSRWSVRIVNAQNQIGQATEKVDPNAAFNWLKVGAGAALVASGFVLNPAGLAGGAYLIYGGFTASANPGIFSYYYGPSGNLVRIDYNGTTSKEFAYDVFARLILAADKSKGTTTRFYYDAMGRRVAKDTTAFSYLGKHLVQEEPGAGGWYKHYIYASDDMVGFATNQRGSLEQYCVQDDRGGTIIFLSEAAGDIRESYSYDLFGKPTFLDFLGRPVAVGSEKGNFFRHQGQYYDTETGMYCVGSRYYDPFLQRFLQPDKVSWDLDTNRYSYVANNAQCLSDPSGSMAFLVAVGLAVAFEAAVGFLLGVAFSAAQQTLLYFDTKGESGFSLKSMLEAGAMGAACGAAFELFPVLALPVGIGFSAMGVYGAYENAREGHYRAAVFDAAFALLPFWHGVRSAFREPARPTTKIYSSRTIDLPELEALSGEEARAVNGGHASTSGENWGLGPVLRGNRLGRGENLHHGFPGIDIVRPEPVVGKPTLAEEITQIKSRNLPAEPAPSGTPYPGESYYRNPRRLFTTTRADIDNLAGFVSARLKGVRVVADASTKRNLMVLIPEGAAAKYRLQIESARRYARDNGVNLIVVEHP